MASVYRRLGLTREVTYKCRDGPLGILARVAYPNESNQEQDDSAGDHAPVEDEATSKTVDGVKGQQISDDLYTRVMSKISLGPHPRLTPMAVTPTPRLNALLVANPASSKK